MALIEQYGKYYCNHNECPYKYCPWYHMGVRVDKTDFSLLEEEAREQGWFTPRSHERAESCGLYMDI